MSESAGIDVEHVKASESSHSVAVIEGENENHAESSGLDETIESMDSTKHAQLVETLKWLSDNYERSDGVCVPRCVLYTHYLDFCQKHEFSPSSAATFGKVIRQKFPKLTTRRLGTRGQSKYHYYGISIKRTSIYYHSVYSGPGLTRFSEKKPKMDGSNKKFSLSSKTGTLLPEYPDAHNLVLPADVSCEKVEIFILMYRTHSQRLLDVIVSNNFDEVQNFLLHFWQGLPPHLSCLLKHDVIVDVIILCDSILYKVLNDVLIPAAIQDIPESLSTEIRMFARKLPIWLEYSLDQIPADVKQKKLKVVRAFVLSLRRQMSFIHLAQTARSVLLSHESVTEMLSDLKEVSSPTSFHQAGLTEELKTASAEMLDEFEALMKKQAPLESFIEWIDCVIDDRLLKPFDSDVDPAQFNSRASEFLMNWSFITGKLMAEFTMRSLKSFGKFHLLNLMLQEYALLAIETQHDKAVHIGYQRNVQQHMKKTAAINTKAMVRSTNRKAGSGYAHKVKKRKQSSSNDQDDSEAQPVPLKSQGVYDTSGHLEARAMESTSSLDVSHQASDHPSESYPSAYPSTVEGSSPNNSYVPLYPGIPGQPYCNSDLNDGPETQYSIPYPRHHCDVATPSEYMSQGVPFQVGAFNHPQGTFPNAILPPHFPLTNSWNSSPNTACYGAYTDLPNAAAHSGNLSPFVSHDQSRDYRNINYPGNQPTLDGRYGSSAMLPNRFDTTNGLGRSFPPPGDYMPTYHHGN